ncbi:MAG: ABC-F family ATP-binding cassette domain-containing protein [Hyphomonadaceae bacterium]
MAQPSRIPPVAALRGVRLSLGGDPLFAGVDLPLQPGQRVALVGRNGAGKSTLMRILSGAVEADEGEVFRQPGVAIRWLPQEPDLSGFATAHAYAAQSLDEASIYRADAELDAWDVPHDLDPAKASGGQARRIALARAFAEDPDVLLLDEPTNHLDVEAIEQLEARLKSFRGAILVVSHDRRFLENVSTAVAWLRQGVVRLLDKGYRDFDAWAETIEEAEERNLEKLETQLKAEERWMARGVTARRRRNMGRVRKLQDMRAERRARKVALSDAAAGASLSAGDAPQSSRLVIEAKGLNKSFETASGPLPIVKDFNLRVMRGDRIGIVGANGAGKTTLLRLLLGLIEPDSGSLRLAQNLELAFLDQMRARLDPNQTLWDALTPIGGDHIMVRGQSRHVAAYAKDFLFGSSQLRQPVGRLSGGERNRLALAIALARPSNLLVLDEPTNDLDIETLDLLEDMLAEYDGTLLLVSHDRAFLDGVVTSLLTPQGQGRWLETAGGYADYLAQRPDPAPSQTAAAASKAATPSPARPRAQAKLSYKDQRRLDELEKLMPAHQADIARLEAELADPQLFSSDPKGFETRAAKLDALREALDGFETEWLELEERRDALTQG